MDSAGISMFAWSEQHFLFKLRCRENADYAPKRACDTEAGTNSHVSVSAWRKPRTNEARHTCLLTLPGEQV